MKLLFAGGEAVGASEAAHARQLSEDAHEVLLEQGPGASFANCGLSYDAGRHDFLEGYRTCPRTQTVPRFSGCTR